MIVRPASVKPATFRFAAMPAALFNCSSAALGASAAYSTAAKGDLYKYQDALPDLPVPPLDHTLALYKRSIMPYYAKGAKDPEYIKYCKVIEEFGKNEGPELQAKLTDFAEGKRNWLSGIWNDYAYFEYRDPVSPFVSYFYSHKTLNTAVGKDQLLKAAALTYQALQFMVQLEAESLAPDVMRNTPFCMEGFRYMFNNNRVPLEGKDTTVRFDPAENRFMLIVSNGYIYKMQTHSDQVPLSPAEIYSGIQKIYLDSHSKPAATNPVGILTSSNRDVWAANYKTLKEDPVSRGSIEDIERASFALCLDETYPETMEEKSREFWHGNGFNRWYDKPVEFIVAKNGASGFIGEHSRMDGTPTLRMNDWVVNQISSMTPDQFVDPLASAPEVEQLKFEIRPSIKEAIQTELVQFNKTVSSLDMKCWQYFGIGKKGIKKFKVSPDAFIQMVMQLAYYKCTGTLRPTYEAASTRAFFAGRTDVCRTVSPEALQFVKDWENPAKSLEEKLSAFRFAVNSHSQFIKEATGGSGIDRHLLGLTRMVDADAPEKPALFADPMFGYAQKWYLSTSQLSSNEFNGWGFAPVIPEGVGLAYMVNNDWLHVSISVFKNNPMGIRAEAMYAYLTEAVNELKAALTEELKQSEPVKAKL